MVIANPQIRKDLSWLKKIMAGPLYDALFIFFGGYIVEVVFLLWWLKLPDLKCPEEMRRLLHIGCFDENCSLFSTEFMEECLKGTWMKNIDAGMPFVITSVTMNGSSGANGGEESSPYLALKMVRYLEKPTQLHRVAAFFIASITRRVSGAVLSPRSIPEVFFCIGFLMFGMFYYKWKFTGNISLFRC